MPPARPNRPDLNAYHYHTYDFAGSVANPAWTPSAPLASRGNLQFYSLVQDLGNLLAVGQARHVPNIALTNGAGQTARHRHTMMLSFGNLANAPQCRAVVITGGIHAREWIATEIAYLIAEYLIVNYPGPNTPPPLTAYQTQLKNLVDTRDIRIIPMVNPDGNRRTVFGTGANDRLWRKNRRRLPSVGLAWINKLAPGGVATAPFTDVGYWTPPVSAWAKYRVPGYDPGNNIPPNAPDRQIHQLPNGSIGVDLNRNMPTDAWGYDCPHNQHYRMWNPAEDSYFGTRRGGEAEASNVQQAMIDADANQNQNLWVTIDYHSYGRAILYPSETAHAGLSAVYTATGTMLQSLIHNQDNTGDYRLGSPVNIPGIGYDATGTVADYAAQQHRARAFTIELDPGGNPGFVLPEDQIQPVFEKNIRAALAAIAAPGSAHRAAVYQNTYDWHTWDRGNRLPAQ